MTVSWDQVVFQVPTHPPRKAPIGRLAGKGAASAIRRAVEWKLRARSAREPASSSGFGNADIVSACVDRLEVLVGGVFGKGGECCAAGKVWGG